MMTAISPKQILPTNTKAMTTCIATVFRNLFIRLTTYDCNQQWIAYCACLDHISNFHCNKYILRIIIQSTLNKLHELSCLTKDILITHITK